MENKWPVKQTIFSRHAMTQMFSISININDVKAVISHHEILWDYLDDRPYPSRLILGFVDEIPIHVVLGYNAESEIGYVITAYQPDPLQWGEDYKGNSNSHLGTKQECHHPARCSR